MRRPLPTVRQATREDFFRACVLLNWPPDSVTYSRVLSEIRSGRVLVAHAFENDAPMAFGGVTDFGGSGGAGHAWFLRCPGAAAPDPSGLMIALRRYARGASDVFSCVICSVRDDNVDGQRLAYALDFRATNRRRGLLREWQRHGRSLGNGDWEASESVRQVAAAFASGTVAAL